jgi:outer membrane protein assembly factor BamB
MARSIRRIGRLSLAVAVGSLACLEAFAQATPLWRYTSRDDVTFFRVTPIGILIVATDSSLSGLDPTTGSALWTRPDPVVSASDLLTIAHTPFALLASKGAFELFDVGSGKTWWNSALLGLRILRGQVALIEQRMLLVYGQRADKGVTLMALDLESGAVRWRQDYLFTRAPEPVGPPRDRTVLKTMLGHQPPVVDTDTTMVLYVSKEGPIKVDLRTGKLLWRAEGLWDEDPPAIIEGYPRMVHARGVLYVPSEKRVRAVDAENGRVLWERAKLKSRPRQLDWTAHGLLVRAPHIDLLDLGTGASVWRTPFTDLEHSTPYVVRGDRVYVAAHGAFYALGLADGTARELSRYELRGDDQPDALEVLDSGFLVRTSQDLVVFDTSGAIRHHAFYEPPKLSALERVAFAAAAVALSYASYVGAKREAIRTGDPQLYYVVNPILKRRYAASTKVRDYYYVLTVLRDTSGNKSPGLVKLNVATGQEESRLQLGDRTPEYQVDGIEGIVFFKQHRREIAAFKL